MVRVRAQSRDATRQSPRFILREHKNNYNNLAVKKVLPIFAREGMQIPISEITEKRTLFMFNQIFTKAMRKFYSFLALAILFLAGAGSTSAQDYYDVIDFDYGPEGAVTDIEPGKLYVLQVANTAEANFFNGATDKVSEATPTSLYTFEEAGEQDGFMTYYLKQKGSGLYLSSNGGVSFTDSKLRAFRFFAKHPTMFMERGVDQVPLDVDPTVLCTFDDEHYGGDTPIADRAFIFTDVENCTSDGWEPASEEEQLGGRETQAPGYISADTGDKVVTSLSSAHGLTRTPGTSMRWERRMLSTSSKPTSWISSQRLMLMIISHRVIRWDRCPHRTSQLLKRHSTRHITSSTREAAVLHRNTLTLSTP